MPPNRNVVVSTMCTSIYFTDKARHVTTVRALADELGIEPVNLVWSDGSSPVEDEHRLNFKYCLCPIEIEESLKHCGYAGDWSRVGDPMCFVASQIRG